MFVDFITLKNYLSFSSRNKNQWTLVIPELMKIDFLSSHPLLYSYKKKSVPAKRLLFRKRGKIPRMTVFGVHCANKRAVFTSKELQTLYTLHYLAISQIYTFLRFNHRPCAYMITIILLVVTGSTQQKKNTNQQQQCTLQNIWGREIKLVVLLFISIIQSCTLFKIYEPVDVHVLI